ncbi:MAG TPA: diguanylate cyclase [Actinomycetota bacterium]|jgi:diguanylate cyclase (GGDEF)-like protein|nr:diguanylate cyclase [Actinomycetota bacterium]
MRVLVVAADRARRAAVRDGLWGAELIEATDELTAGALAVACRPDVIVLDAEVRELVSRIRNDFRTTLIPVVNVVDAQPSDTDAYGPADDFLVRPFTDEELSARVRLAMHRTHELGGVSPVTGLPGNKAVDAAIRDRQARGAPFACLYIDIDDFKSFNDEHGFAAGDETIRSVAACVLEVIEKLSPEECFVAHVGGDDFIVLAGPGAAEGIAREVVGTFAGDGCSISVGVVKQAHVFVDLAALGRAAADAKSAAKAQRGSSWAVFSPAESRA